MFNITNFFSEIHCLENSFKIKTINPNIYVEKSICKLQINYYVWGFIKKNIMSSHFSSHFFNISFLKIVFFMNTYFYSLILLLLGLIVSLEIKRIALMLYILPVLGILNLCVGFNFV